MNELTKEKRLVCAGCGRENRVLGGKLPMPGWVRKAGRSYCKKCACLMGGSSSIQKKAEK